MYRRDSFTIARLVTTGSKKEYTAQGTSIVGQLDPVGNEFASIADGAFGKVYTLTSPQLEVDVRIGDRLTKASKNYEVKGLQKFDSARVPTVVLQLVEAQI